MGVQQVIMVQIAKRGWTIAALHAVCQMAKPQNSRILLVKMVPVQHIAWLGTELGYLDLTYAEEEEIGEYMELIEEYEVECDLCIFQYSSLVSAVAQIVEESKAQLLFANLPTSIVPGWRNFQLYRLRRSLAKQKCELIETPRFAASEELPTDWHFEEKATPEEMPLVFNPFEIKERV